MQSFEEELARVLPADIPHRDQLIQKASRHLQMIAEANESMNLTRIETPQEAAIKHIYDSVAPWKFFQNADRVLDAGTGAGFPGIPLAIVLPQTRFLLAESIGKKARFVDSVLDALELSNARVRDERAEEVALSTPANIITARAVAPVARIFELFNKSMKAGAKVLLYKGPDVENELMEGQKLKIAGEVLYRYDLPDNLGTRTLVEIHAAARSKRLKRENQPA